MKIEIRRRPVKYARIEVKPDGRVVVTAPEGGFNVEKFIAKNAAWLEGGKLAQIEGLKELAESGFPLNGEFYKVIHGRRAKVHDSFRTVVLPLIPKTCGKN